jgi:hypothetical protein
MIIDEKKPSNVVSLAKAGRSLAEIARLEGRSKSSVQRELEKEKGNGAVIPLKSNLRAAIGARASAILNDWRIPRCTLADLSKKHGFTEKQISSFIATARDRGDRRALTKKQKNTLLKIERRRVQREKARRAALALSPAEKMGIKIGREAVFTDYSRRRADGAFMKYVVTLSAGDEKWNCLAKHFNEEENLPELLAA